MEKKDFKPSKYQQDIFDFIEHGSGNLVVEALAGSGKTSTIVKALDIIPKDKKVLFLAFNNTVANTLKEKTVQHKNVTVRTVYQIGRAVVSKNLGKIEIDEHKYTNEFIKNKNNYTLNGKPTLKSKWKAYFNNIRDLVKHVRLNLGETIKDIKEIAKNYEITLIADEALVVKKLIDWGKKNNGTIDFPDMIWYPIVFDFPSECFSKFDYVFVDEAQDLSKCQRELILKYNNENTRYIFVGDSNQAIYGFNSADPKSFEELKKIPNTSVLPLSICYRCPKKVISFVQRIVPQIEHAENAIDGSISFDKVLNNINDGDTILCRNNAPLMQLYTSFVRMGKKVFIEGKELESSLSDLISVCFNESINSHLKEKGLMSELYKFYFNKRKEMMETTGWDAGMCDELSDLTSLLDKIETIKVLSEGINHTSGLIDRINRIFSNVNTEGIRLVTVHKAKGAEYPNVYIAKPELFDPSKKNLEWEKIQERNLEYVAYTRAQRNLSFIKDNEIKNSYTMPLSEAEKLVDSLYNPLKQINPVGSSRYETITGVTLPGVTTNISDNKLLYSHTISKNPLLAAFGKKNNKRRKF